MYKEGAAGTSHKARSRVGKVWRQLQRNTRESRVDERGWEGGGVNHQRINQSMHEAMNQSIEQAINQSSKTVMNQIHS